MAVTVLRDDESGRLTGEARQAAELRLPQLVRRQLEPGSILGVSPAFAGPTFRGQAADIANRAYFRIYYKTLDRGLSFFNFALLPAIENYLPIQNQGAKVPELKPGICLYTKVRHRNAVVPGSTPVQQTIGIESRTMMLVGLFIGKEKINVLAATTPTEGIDSRRQFPAVPDEAIYTNNSNGYDLAEQFHREVVQAGEVVKIDIWSPVFGEIQVADLNNNSVATALNIKAEGLISGFRLCTSRINRAYYAIDLTITRYQARKRS